MPLYRCTGRTRRRLRYSGAGGRNIVRSVVSRQLGIIVAAATTLDSSAFAAQPTRPIPPDPMNYTLRAVRIDASEAPMIDGDLSYPAWAKAAILDDFHQVDPDT